MSWLFYPPLLGWSTALLSLIITSTMAYSGVRANIAGHGVPNRTKFTRHTTGSDRSLYNSNNNNTIKVRATEKLAGRPKAYGNVYKDFTDGRVLYNALQPATTTILNTSSVSGIDTQWPGQVLTYSASPRDSRPRRSLGHSRGTPRIRRSAISSLTSSRSAVSNITSSRSPVSNITSSRSAVSNITSSRNAVSNITSSRSAVSNITSSRSAVSKPTIRIIVRVRRKRAMLQDFTQVNRDVCPPSLCRTADESSRGGLGRPRRTGGTVFYQGDIVLDPSLDRIIYPRTEPAAAERMQRRNQRGQGKISKTDRRTRNGPKADGDGLRLRTSRNKSSGGTKTKRRTCKKRGSGEKGGEKRQDKNRGRENKRKRLRKGDAKRRPRRSSGNGNYGDSSGSDWRGGNGDSSGSDVSGSCDSWEGDEAVPINKVQMFRMQERSGRRRRATMKMRNRLWKNGAVVYKMAREINPEAKLVIERAIRHIQQRTCIRFREKKSSDRDFIRFISEPGCWSQIGRVGGSQMVSIGRGCESLGTAVHEIVHSLGVWHEQARPDRDRYVRVLEDNISEKFRPDFEKVGRRLATDRGYSYDYQSLMHYSKYAFTRNGDPTMQVIGPGSRLKLRIGQRRGLSTIDISQLRDMYKCNFRTDVKETVCHKGWEKYLTSCYKFVTSPPAQFSTADRACKREKSNLLAVESSKEQRFIDKVLNKNYTRVYRWRTAGRKVNGTVAWYLNEKSVKRISKYEKWARGQPGSRTSLVLARDPRSGSVTWAGEWEGDARTPNYYRHPYICEKPARRKCVELRHRDGRDYRGHLDHTRDGYTCQRWTENYPHDHPLVNVSRAAAAASRAASGGSDSSSSNSNSRTTGRQVYTDGLGSHNKCRNPSGLRRNRPWCYTSKRRHEWGYCDVSVCAGSLQRGSSRGGARQGGASQGGARQGGARQATPREGTPRQGTSRHSGSRRTSPTRGSTTRGTTREGSSRRGSTRQGTSSSSTTRQGTSRQDGTRRTGQRQGTPRQSGSNRPSPRQGTPRQSGSNRASPRQGTPRQSGSNRPSPRQGTPRQSGSNRASARQGTPRQSGSNRPSPRQGTPRQSGSNRASPRQGTPRQSGSNRASPRQGIPRQSGSNRASPRQGTPRQNGSNRVSSRQVTARRLPSRQGTTKHSSSTRPSPRQAASSRRTIRQPTSRQGTSRQRSSRTSFLEKERSLRDR